MISGAVHRANPRAAAVEHGQDALIGVSRYVLGLPERGASPSPAKRSLAKRTRHLLTTPRAQPTSRAITRLAMPAAAASTILAAPPAAAPWLALAPSLERRRSSADNTIGVASGAAN